MEHKVFSMNHIVTDSRMNPFASFCSHECTRHEGKARKRKEELEAQASEVNATLAEHGGESGGFSRVGL